MTRAIASLKSENESRYSDWVLEPFSLPFVQRAILEVLLLSVGAGILGTWIVLRGLAFYAHAVGTAAFPGLVLADGLGFSPAIGAFGAALLFAAGMDRLSKGREDGADSMTALALVAALVVGVILASDVFHSGSQIQTLLFGSLLALGTRDLVLAGTTSVLAAFATLTLGRRWLAVGFDASGSRALGIRSQLSEIVLLLLVALSVTAALSTAGALLATALFVVPAATTRLWIERLRTWQIATVATLAVEGTFGLWLAVRTNAPPGATIATVAGVVFALSASAHVLAGARRSSRGPSRRVGVTVTVAGAIVLAGVAAACSNATTPGAAQVVASTTQIGDWVRTVARGAVSVHQILQPNTDPHEYEPRPKDVEAVAGAGIVFENGDNLDAWMAKVIADSGGHPAVTVLGDRLPVRLPGQTSGADASRFDPHWWHDPVNAEAAVEQIRSSLERTFPADAATFDANASAYLKKLRVLDAGLQACFATVPPDERLLVTDHDAFDYFAERYGIRVIGAIIPSQTTQGEPSAQDLARLIALIRSEHVRAVFPESSLSAKLAESIAAETGASSDHALYGDTLGPPGSPADTYLRMELANADSMVRGFSGGTHGCAVPGIT
jgi:ABC-type Zn uptake system ZnuABC Zn-binding protein ZnuA/ABC-type Mn2+/Zn2+ transport system permease subunit